MKVRIQLELDVGDTPRDDAGSFFIDQYGEYQEEPTIDVVEGVVCDILRVELADQNYFAAGAWVIEAAHIVEVEEEPVDLHHSM